MVTLIEALFAAITGASTAASAVLYYRTRAMLSSAKDAALAAQNFSEAARIAAQVIVKSAPLAQPLVVPFTTPPVQHPPKLSRRDQMRIDAQNNTVVNEFVKVQQKLRSLPTWLALWQRNKPAEPPAPKK